VSDDATVSNLPQSFDLDLDSYQKPVEEQIAPFTVKLGQRIVTFNNPDEVDWKDLLDITDPVQFIRFSCSREDREFIFGQKLEGYKMAKLMEAYMTHFKIDEKVDRARQAERFRR
jgi:hypothetical protein